MLKPDTYYSETGGPARLPATVCWAMVTNEMKYCTARKTKFCTGPTLYRHEKPNGSTKEGPVSFALLEYPFASVSTVNNGHPFLVSLVKVPETSRPPERSSKHKSSSFFLSWGSFLASKLQSGSATLYLIVSLNRRHPLCHPLIFPVNEAVSKGKLWDRDNLLIFSF